MPTWNQLTSQLRHPDNPVVSVMKLADLIMHSIHFFIIFNFTGKR